MIKKLAKSMKKKGWNDKEIKHMETSLSAVKRRDNQMRKDLNKFFFWNIIAAAIILNFLGILIISPFLIAFDGFTLYAIAIILGACMGMLVNYITLSTAHLEMKRHFYAAILIPILIGINLKLGSGYLDMLSKIFNMTDKSTIELALSYSIAFIFPYAFSIALRSMKDKKK